MQIAPESAFLLLTLPNCKISENNNSEAGPFGLECVTVSNPATSEGREVYLVLKLNESEFPIDPTGAIQRTDTPSQREYTFFKSTSNESSSVGLVLSIPRPAGDAHSNPLQEDLETLDNILEQYTVDFRPSASQAQLPPVPDHPPPAYVTEQKELRGCLVMMNEETGEVVAQVDNDFRVREDPTMYQPGHTNDPVIIEVPDEAGLREGDANIVEAFARIVPPDQQDWITKSATTISHAISFTTNLFITTITTASNYYISKSRPSPHHSSANLTVQDSRNPKGGSPTPSRTPSPTPPPLPPRALVFLTSARTRKNLRTVHAVSGQAVKISAKTINTIDSMIRHAMGAKPKQNRLGYVPGQASSPSPIPYTSPSPPTIPAPAPRAPYTPAPDATTSTPGHWNPDSKPPLPPRSNTQFIQKSGVESRQLPPLPPRNTFSPQGLSQSPPQQYQQQPNYTTSLPLQPKLTTGRRLLISADFILSTIDHSARKVLDSSTNNLGRVMHHKYGAEAAESSVLMASTARNVGLVYIDMSGIGRRALLRRAGMNFVKGRLHGRAGEERPVPPVPGQQPQK